MTKPKKASSVPKRNQEAMRVLKFLATATEDEIELEWARRSTHYRLSNVSPPLGEMMRVLARGFHAHLEGTLVRKPR